MDRPEGGESANRDKTNLGGVRSLPILPCLLSGSSCFYGSDRTTDTDGDNGGERADANGLQKERRGERVRDSEGEEGAAEEESAENSVAAN